MPVTKRLMAPGNFEITLDDDILPAPYETTDNYNLYLYGFGHVLVFPAPIPDPDMFTDAQLLDYSVFTGIVRTVEDRTRIRGPHVSAWLGDEDGKGDLLEVAVTKPAGTFAQWITDLRPAAVALGSLGAPAGTLNWSTNYGSRREAIDYVCEYFGCEWQVTDNVTLNADTATNLYGSATVIATPWWDGRDMELTGIRARFGHELSLDDYTTKVLAKDDAGGVGSASIGTGYLDIFGNALQTKRFVDGSSGVKAGTANAYASGQLAQWDHAIERLTCRSDTFCVMADVACGGYLLGFDPDHDVYDLSNEIHYAGRILWPRTLRVQGLTMPLREGMGVLFRDQYGHYTVLDDHIRWEAGDAVIEVGDPAARLSRAIRRRTLQA